MKKVSLIYVMTIVMVISNVFMVNSQEMKAVDLGLRAKWATTNLGASDSTQSGNFYSWGEIETKSNYSSDNYKYMRNDTIIKYYPKVTDGAEMQDASSDGTTAKRAGIVDNKQYLELADDAAYKTLGGNWRIPSRFHMNELITLCTWEAIRTDSICGYKVTGPNGNSIFLPAAGFITDTMHLSKNIIGSYWLNKIYTCQKFNQATNMLEPYVEVNGGSTLDFGMNEGTKIQSIYCMRVYGCPIRPILVNPSVEQLSNEEWKLLQFMRENPTLPIKSIPSKIKEEPKKINSYFSKLKKLKLVHWEGGKADGKWIFAEM